MTLPAYRKFSPNCAWRAMFRQLLLEPRFQGGGGRPGMSTHQFDNVVARLP